MMLRRLLKVTALVFFISPVINAQSLVSGRVSDKDSKEPLAGVYVIYGKGAGTSTDAAGLYSFTCDTGRLEITFKYIGYKPVTEIVFLGAKETVRLDVILGD